MTARSRVTWRRHFLIVLLVFPAPFLVSSLYLYMSRWPVRWCTGETDMLMLGAAIVPVVAGIVLLPIQKWHNVLLAVIYATGIALVLIAFSLMFVCGAFGDCL
jgi:hypothetical protein